MTIKIKQNMSNIDIYCIIREMRDILKEGFIDNIYEINDSLLLIKCRTKKGKARIVLDASKRIHLTNYDYPVPKIPSQYCMSLRKHMKGRRILDVYQHGLDRILILELGSKEGKPWKFIIELFLGGNFILVDDKGLIFMAKHYKIIKDRKILAKKEYVFPKSRGIDPFNVKKEEFTEIIKNYEKDVVRAIARNINIAGYLAEEICIRAGVDKNKKCAEITDVEIDSLYEQMQNLLKEIEKYDQGEKIKGYIYTDKEGNYIDFEPIKLERLSEYTPKEYPSFNEAVDDYFAKFDSELLMQGELKAAKRIVEKYERIKRSQEEQIKQSIENREKHLEYGNLIYAHFDELNNLLGTILQARKKGISWKEIDEKMELGKSKGIRECLLYERSYPEEAKISVNLDGVSVKLDIRKSVVENANEYYRLAKKDKRRIEGAREALKKTEETLKRKLEEKKLKEEEKVGLLKRPKKSWYEKYRWFISSDGILVVGGKDASSNETLVKKYMDKKDLFFHTELRGAPAVIVKVPQDGEVPELTKKEAAQFAASYSNAWREGWGNTKIFYVNAEQVSKTPKPGEYLTKGAFVIRGNKNFLPEPYLELCIGVKFVPVGDNGESNEEKVESTGEKPEKNEEEEETIYYPKIIAGPLSAIKKQTDNYVRIRPMKKGLSGGKLASKIREILIAQTPENMKKWARFISNNDILHFLPPGSSDIVRKK